MDKTVPCFCDKKRIDPDDADLVLNGVPICTRQCLYDAERALMNKRESLVANRKPKPRGWDVV